MRLLERYRNWFLAIAVLGAVPHAACQGDTPYAVEEAWYRKMRERMVQTQIERRGIKDPRVLDALRTVPRHRFVPDDLAPRAYDDNALPIGEEQTISQPYIVAIMTELLQLGAHARVLEIGTGSGYQAAVLSALVDTVYTIEIVKVLADQAEKRLSDLGYLNVRVRHGDGYRGWPEHAPFDAVIVTAAPDHVPQPLVDQLKEGGRMVIPVGLHRQDLTLLVKKADGLRRECVIPVRFVPMTGEAEER